jgi:hypothetical protein
MVRSFQLEGEPNLSRQVLPAWQEYQQQRRPGTPAAKFVLYMDPAPVLVGNVDQHFNPIFSESQFARGGRSITPDLFEFYTRDDPISIRLDIWTEKRGDPGPHEEVFQAPLQVSGDSLSVLSLDQQFSLPIAPGAYLARVILINRGIYPDAALPGREWFENEDLERYEILLERSSN